MERLERHANRVVAAFLLLIGLVMTLSVKDDTLTTDEGLYLPTGYRLLTEGTIRIGFEHPPLMRVLAALPLPLFLDLRPASDYIDAANRDLNGEVWAFGDRFVYDNDESAEWILLAGRLPMIAFTLAFVFLVYRVVRARCGLDAALVATVTLALSPFFLAHGRLVTLDVPTAFGAFIVLLAVARYLERRDWAATTLMGLAIGVALLIKFSMLSMMPFVGMACVAYILAFRRTETLRCLGQGAVAGLVSLGLISAVYAFFLQGYAAAEQVSDIHFVLSTTRPEAYPRLKWIAALAEVDALRPLAEYAFGAAWQLSRGGAFGYFMGEGSHRSWPGFYPVGYWLKQPLAVHALALIAIWQLVTRTARALGREGVATFRDHVFVWLGAGWVGFYLFVLIGLNSGNTGSRYLLPALPFIAVLIALGCVAWVRGGDGSRARRLRGAALAALLLAQGVSSLVAYPSFLAYFNELVDADAASYYLVDTDADWGQDVKRLDRWLREHDVPKVKLAMQMAFRNADGATGEPVGAPMLSGVFSNAYEFYLSGRYEALPPGVPTTGWIAIPARLLRWGQARAAATQGWTSDSYRWLAGHEPVAVVGHSIFVFNVKP